MGVFSVKRYLNPRAWVIPVARRIKALQGLAAGVSRAQQRRRRRRRQREWEHEQSWKPSEGGISRTAWLTVLGCRKVKNIWSDLNFGFSNVKVIRDLH